MIVGLESEKLIAAVNKNDLEEVRKILEDLKNKGTQEDISQVVNFEMGAFGMRAMHLAAIQDNLEVVKLLLDNGGHADAADRLGRTPLHFASESGSPELLQLFLQNGAYVNARYGITTFAKKVQIHEIFDSIPLPKNFGRTPLHAATSNLYLDCVKILLENKADVNIEDDEGQTPLLTTGESLKSKSNVFKKQFESIIDLLLKHKARIHYINCATGKGLIHRALEFDSLKTCKELLRLGYDVTKVDNNGDTILHDSCKSGNADFTREIINKNPKLINQGNKKKETPMHFAAYANSKSCLILLLNNGGDLSKTTEFDQSVIDLILSSVPRPTKFLLKILDSKIIPNRSSANEKLFNVTLDYQILAPDSDFQMSVILSLIKSLNSDQKSQIMLHPLIESFIRQKWTRIRFLFVFLVVLHLFYVVSLSVYVVFLFDLGAGDFLNTSRLVMLFTAAALLLHVITEVSLAPKYYLKEYETWLTMACVSLSLAMGLGEYYLEFPPSATIENMDRVKAIPEWIRHAAAYDILLSWILVMFILGRFPFVGYFALMFSSVLRNVLKVLLFFTCLVIGFSLSFCIQFNDEHFSDPWKSFVRTTIMLMGEFEYRDLLQGNLILNRFDSVPNSIKITSHIILLLFVLLGSIVLMNLIMGLAVNDIQGIRAEGCVRHIIKQAEFISHVEKILSKDKFPFLPKRMKNFICDRKILPGLMVFEPNSYQRSYGSRWGGCKNQVKSNISYKLMESIMSVAVKHQKNRLKNHLNDELMLFEDDRDEKDLHEWMDEHIDKNLHEIKNEFAALSLKMDEFMKSFEPKGKQFRSTVK